MPVAVAKSSQIVTSIVQAGQPYPIRQTGEAFYLTLASGPLWIQPEGGSLDQYSQGTGKRQDPSLPFKGLQIFNRTSKAIVFQLRDGYGDYIDNRVILANGLVSDVVLPTSPVANSLNEIDIPDLSSTSILDVNGVAWLAIQRKAIYISNLDTASAYNLEGLDSHLVVITAHPQSALVFPVAGNFRIKLPLSNINAIVSEIYEAVLPTTLSA